MGNRGVVSGRGVTGNNSHDPKRCVKFISSKNDFSNIYRTTPPSLSELEGRCEKMRALLEEKQLQLEAMMQTVKAPIYNITCLKLVRGK